MIPFTEQFPSESLLDDCADRWGLKELLFIRKMENIVFSATAPSGKVFLRLTSPIRRLKPEIEAEIDWIEHLARNGLKVPRIIPDKSGNTIVSLQEEDQRFEATLFAEMKGEHPQETKTTEPKFIQTLGALIAKMHEANLTYKGAHLGLKREEWFEERGLRHALWAAQSSSEKPLQNRLKTAVDWLKSLPRNSNNYGLVHIDLGALNLFVDDDDTIGIIDFDDSCNHWFVFDLAIVIFSMAGRRNHTSIRPEETEWLSHLIQGYRTVRPLSEEDVLLIPRFITFAALRLFFWIESHETLGTFHKDALNKVARQKAWTKARAENSKNFF